LFADLEVNQGVEIKPYVGSQPRPDSHHDEAPGRLLRPTGKHRLSGGGFDCLDVLGHGVDAWHSLFENRSRLEQDHIEVGDWLRSTRASGSRQEANRQKQSTHSGCR
jgi:hypothetical protein